MIKLSKNFSLYELIRSQYALRHNIDNNPSNEVLENLQALCVNVLQPIRDAIKKPIRVNSGYRCLTLNTGIGGAKTSQHILGMAADIECPGYDNFSLANFIKDSVVVYDQLILEYYAAGNKNSGWVHISYKKDSENRMEELTKFSKINGYYAGILNFPNQ